MPQTRPDRKWARFGVSALWGLLMLAFFAAVVLASMTGAGYLKQDVLPARLVGSHGDELIEAAAVVAGVAAVMVCRRARIWWLRARLRGLRRRGVRASATVIARDSVRNANPRGPAVTTYTISLRWPEASGERSGQRCYRFFDPGDKDFLKRTRSGATVTVYHPPGRPHRFVLDIPYAPTIADFFL